MPIIISRGCNLSHCVLLLLAIVLSTDALAATRQQCRNSLVVNEVQQLNFGNFVGDPGGGTITVTPLGTRTTTGPVLAGGTVTAGVFSLYSTRNGCNIYPVRISYRGNPSLSGSGTNMPINTFIPPNNSTVTLSPLANDPITVNIGANLDVNASQAGGPYTGTYRVRFRQ